MRKSVVSLKPKTGVKIQPIPEPMETSTFSLRSDIGEMKWSDTQKSTLTVRELVESEKPKNIFDDDEEKLEGCEKVLESKLNCYSFFCRSTV